LWKNRVGCKAHFVTHTLYIIMQEELEHVFICSQ
jgi:hypothetical protein